MQKIAGYFQMAHASEMKRFCRPSDLADFPRDPLPGRALRQQCPERGRYICLKFNQSSCADVPSHEKNLPNQRSEINGS